jgi:aromatic-L-amino-acid decarboxylase
VPLDLSVLYTRRPEVVRAAFSLLPEYLRTAEESAAPNLMDYGVSLGRRFRALKLWMVLRAFGQQGMAARIREHVRLARLFEAWVAEDARFERMAPAPFSVVCFRGRFERLPAAAQDDANQRLMDAVNATGEAYLSHTRVRGRLTLRMAVANLRTQERHVRRAWELIRGETVRLGG